jgi:2-oxoglutarate dehydrogenase E1 component
VLCTGKVYYDLVATREERGYDDTAIVRVEQLYPLRKDDLLELLSAFPDGTPVVWVQEEPKNMGAWAYMNRELQGLLAGSFQWSCVSRPLSASPATGSMKRHTREQTRLMADAFGRSV